MRGLWVKDLLLLQKQLKTFLMFMVIAAFNAYTIKSVPVIFIFMTFFFVTTAASTIFYDQENHGFLYLFTLPTRKKDYVIQKQLLILASSLVAVVLSLVLIFLMMQFDPELQASAARVAVHRTFRFLFRLPLRCHHHPVIPEIRHRKSPHAAVCDHGRIRAGRNPDPKDGCARGNNGFQLYCQRGSLQFAANNRIDPRAGQRCDGAFHSCQPTVYR